jgi:hypothetical protein
LIFSRLINGSDSEDSLICSVSVVFRLFTDRYFPFLLLRILSSVSAVLQRANINERVDRLLASVHAKLEDDNIEMEEHNIEMEENNIEMEEHNIEDKSPMECPNGSYTTQFLHKYVHMFTCPGILSTYTSLLSHLLI